MSQKSLLELFLEDTDDKLLKSLLETYCQNRKDDETVKINLLVKHLQAIFEEQCHADS